MKVLVCGGRAFIDKASVERVMRLLPKLYPQFGEVTHVITGGARGADTLGHQWAEERDIPTTRIYADWPKFGKRAGPIRNARMLEESPDLVVAFPGGAGTADMKQKAVARGIPVWDALEPFAASRGPDQGATP